LHLPPLFRVGRAVAVLFPMFFSAGCAETTLRHVWEARLAERIVEPPGWSAARSHPVLEIAFSPDGKKLAATIDDHFETRAHSTHLLILDAQSPQKPFQQLNLETCGHFLSWAPAGNVLLVCGMVVRLDNGGSCDLRETSLDKTTSSFYNHTFWFNEDHVIRADRTITDLSCRPSGTWAVENNWGVADSKASKGWVLLQRSFRRTIEGKTLLFNRYMIADRDSGRLTSGVFADTYGDGGAIVVPAAELICSTVEHAGQGTRTLGCWHLPGGNPAPLAPKLRDWRIARVSLNTPIVVAERFGYSWTLLGDAVSRVNVMVIDIRSGRGLIEMNAPQRASSSPQIRDSFFQYALSPDGGLLAEGGDGTLRLLGLQ